MNGLQPYVLRSWEKEFPGIGVQKSPDTARLYRESDVEQVRRIKQLVFGEGLTVSGARRRLEETMPAVEAGASNAVDVLGTLGADARSRIDLVRMGLRSMLDVLSKRAGASELPDLPRSGATPKGAAARSKAAEKSRPSRTAARGARARSAGRGRPSRRPVSKSSKRRAKRGVARKAKGGKRKRASA